MADLKQTYIDIKGITHRVVHLAAPNAEERANRERVAAEVLDALTRPVKRRSDL